MSIDANRGSAAPRISDDNWAQGARRPYRAPRLGLGQSVRELTRAVEGSMGDGGGGGTGMMVMGGTGV